jgi:transposase
MIPAELRILVCTEPLDMRLGFDRLAATVRDRLGEEPLSGGLYIFANRGATRLKLLWFDRGLCLLYKRRHGGSSCRSRATGHARCALRGRPLPRCWPESIGHRGPDAAEVRRYTERDDKEIICCLVYNNVTMKGPWQMVVVERLDRQSPASW